jgi:hypothetical protein
MKTISIFSLILLILLISGPASPAICQVSASTGTTPSSSPDRAILTWEAPTKNTDGTPLLDLAGYKIYCEPASRDYRKSMPQKTVYLDDSGLSCKKNAGRTECTYILTVHHPNNEPLCFAVKAFNTSGIDSGFSNEARK